MRRRYVAILSSVLLVGSAGLVSFDAAEGSTIRPETRPGTVDQKATPPRLRLDAGLVRFGSGNWRTLTRTTRYGTVITSSGNAGHARRLPGRVLIYGCPVNIPHTDWSHHCGVSWVEAVANGWLLKDDDGNYVPYGDGYSYLTDIGSSTFQKRWISGMVAEMRAHPGVDGVFIDNVIGSLIGPSSKYRDSESYRAAMHSFIKTVGPALRRRDWYVAVNASLLDGNSERLTGQAYDGTQFIWWIRQIAPYVDGINLERWQQNWDSAGSVRLSGATGSQAWDGWQRVPAAVQRLHKDFYAMEQGSLNDVNKATYLRASFLLAWRRGAGAFFYTDDYAGKGDPWNPAWMIDIGRPSGVMRRVGVGWRRSFTKGTVIVNPDPSASQTFSFRRGHLLPDGRISKAVTLTPGTGLILPFRTVH